MALIIFENFEKKNSMGAWKPLIWKSFYHLSKLSVEANFAFIGKSYLARFR